MDAHKGFTLVELAIVITIIGLLIGGVLKGQELLQNARMTSAASRQKSLQAAAVTFKDIYKALPGDMLNPSSFLQNCTVAPCNTPGDGNGVIGTNNNMFGTSETMNFWGHLARAGLVSGVDTDTAWTTAAPLTASMPDFPMGGKLTVVMVSMPVSATYPNGEIGHSWYPISPISATAHTAPMTQNIVAKYDLKTDDGKPALGDIYIWGTSPCGLPSNAQSYDPNITAACYVMMKAGF